MASAFQQYRSDVRRIHRVHRTHRLLWIGLVCGIAVSTAPAAKAEGSGGPLTGIPFPDEAAGGWNRADAAEGFPAGHFVPKPPGRAHAQPGASQGRIERWIFPADTDPAIDQWLEPHFVSRHSGPPARDRLFVFLAGSYALPAVYQDIVRTAADEGFPAVGLRYPNSWSVNLDLCGFSTDRDCHEKARLEILDGVDASGLIEVTPVNSLSNRLVRLLEYLDGLEPEAGWSSYVRNGRPVWERMIIAGHSQGGGHAAFIASRHEVGRVVMFAGGADLFFGRGFAPWLGSHVTPSDRYWGFVHLQDTAQAFLGAWQILGLGEFGAPVSVDAAVLPYGGSHQLLTGLAPAVPGEYHAAVVADAFTPRDALGRPVYLPVWRYLMSWSRPRMDFDGDGDVDDQDMARMLTCARGAGVPVEPDCRPCDLDGDTDVDQADFGVLQRCLAPGGTWIDSDCLD